ncbi:MAG: cation:proton antiporter [Dehalococcoidia bacterium]
MDVGEIGLIGDLAIVIVAALVGGILARLLRLPALMGYLAAGLVVRPNTFGLTAELEQIPTVAELGVAFLMFALGVQFSFRELMRVRRVAILGGAAQILITMALGLAVGRWLGLDATASLFLGAIIALSSTMVASSLIGQRGELASLYGRVAIGLLIVQDLSVVPLMVMLPAAAGDGALWSSLGLALVKGVGLVLGAYFLGTRIVPWLLQRVAETRSRELFLLSIVSLALGTAIGSFALGLSLAFGAFLAGLVVSESEFSHQTLAEVLPLRDIFATVFFVSVGMLIDPAFIADHADQVAVVVAVASVGKFLLVAALTLAFGYSVRVALGAGLALAQMGEFSFILADVGVDEGVIDEEIASLALSAVLVSILLSPLLLPLQAVLAPLAPRLPLLGRALVDKVVPYLGEEEAPLERHAIICGYGRTGRELAHALTLRRFRFLVVEYDPFVIDQLRKEQLPAIYGDATNPTVLERAGTAGARLLAVTIPDPAAAEAAVAHAKRLNPTIDVIARGAGLAGHTALRQAGATEVVHAEFEAGLEFVRHTLHRFGVSSMEIQALLARRRADYYADQR